MSYTTYDFSESLMRADIKPEDIQHVEAAWGTGDGAGEDAGHYKWAQEGVSDWQGGFLLRLVNGTFAYLTGWCDYTGWGCQDGVEVHRYDELPELSTLPPVMNYAKTAPVEEWDIEPADLNLWLTNGAKDSDRW